MSPRTIRAALAHIESGVIREAVFVDGACPLLDLPYLLRRMALENRAIKTLVRTQSAT
jgi:hypothetical protein